MYEQYAEMVVDNVQSIDVQSEWSDDHILCAGANIIFKDGFSFNPAFWWIGNEGVSALKYYDSPKARKDLVALFFNYLETEGDSLYELMQSPEFYDNMDAAEKQHVDEVRRLFEHFNIPIDC